MVSDKDLWQTSHVHPDILASQKLTLYSRLRHQSSSLTNFMTCSGLKVLESIVPLAVKDDGDRDQHGPLAHDDHATLRHHDAHDDHEDHRYH